MAGETSPSPSTEGNQLSDNLILDTPLSSNPPSSLSGTDTQPSLSSKMHSPKEVPVNSTVISLGGDNTEGDETGVAIDSSVVAKEGTDVPQKEGSDFSTENIFEGALTKSKEGTSNILQSEAEIIEGFITALGTREKDVGEESPSAEGSRSASDVGNCPFIHESGEPSSQEAPNVVASPKWDGTPTQPNVGIPETLAPSGGTTGTQGGPATRGIVKKSLDLILEESRQNTLKRRRVTRKTVLDEEDPSSPIVDLDTVTPSQPTKEIPKTENKVHHSGGVSKKRKKLVVIEKPIEGPSAPVLRSKRKHFIDKCSKGKCTVNTTLRGDVKERVANIRKQKVLGGRIFYPDIAGMQGMQELIEIVSYQGWEHLFPLPIPIMYEPEVPEFYASLSFTDDDETVFAKVGGVELEFDSISLGKILDVHTAGEFTQLEECECVAKKGGIGGQSTVSSFIEAQRRGTEEIKRLTMLVTQKDDEIAVLKAAQSSEVPSALLDLQEENALLKSDNGALRKQMEELAQQMICDQRTANEWIDKLLAKL
ncbi:hypothetical protein HAX54_013987 [Datura stramonium]|uniref:Uncharacterized protein n=1 Tax=Datura stramonium TaxID=4076 RepID=A0ABS8RYM5_DATST|nr:hypothetical protein [Datura stramonium]